MTKLELTLALTKKLDGLPWEEVERSMEYYDELINDRMEEGMSEEEAVAALGSVDEIAAQILADIPLTRIVRAKVKQKSKMRAWEIVLLILGFPVWFPLLISVAAVIFSIYVTIWSIVITLYAVDLVFAVTAVASLPISIFLICTGNLLFGLLAFGTALIMAGLTIGWFFLCKYATKGTWWLGKQTLLGTKALFIRKGDEQ